MRKICFLLVIFLLSTVSVAAETVDHVVISEIQIAGGSENDEWIEIYNPTNLPINLAPEFEGDEGFRVERWTDSGGKSILVRFGNESDATFPGGTTIPAHGFYLIMEDDADENLLLMADTLVKSFELKDNYAVAIGTDSMSDGVDDENVVDFVGFDQNTFFEGLAAALNPAAGGSIERKSGETHDDSRGNGWDTDDNFADFFSQSSPNPQNSESDVEDPNPPVDENSPPEIPTELSPNGSTNSKIF
ncbi:MAG: lamin tail domain-containing protein, partial [Patescibacteria group bacterium]